MDAIDIIEMSHDLFSTKFGEDGKANTLAATDYKEPPVVCYSIGSMNSKGMLSSNPRAGIHRTDVSRTIDANGSNPAGYQGGDLIIIEKCYGISRSMLKGGMNAGGMPVGKNIQPAITANGCDAICYENSSGGGIAAALDASYYKGQGVRLGIEREFVAIRKEEHENIS